MFEKDAESLFYKSCTGYFTRYDLVTFPEHFPDVALSAKARARLRRSDVRRFSVACGPIMQEVML